MTRPLALLACCVAAAAPAAQGPDAVETELKEFLKNKPAGARGVIPAITPAMLRAKLAGRASYDPKTGVLSLTYRFADKNELKDFDVGDGKPALAPGTIGIPPGESV